MEQTPLSWKAKAFLVAFGVFLSLIAALIFKILYNKAPRGTEFESLKDLRSKMLDDSAIPASDTGSNLRGLVVPHPDDKIIFDLIPNLDITFQRAPVKLNSCGMRSPELEPGKPARTFRIALLGDSFAFGWGVKQNESFAQVLEDKLNSISNGNPHFEVLNFGTPGYSTFQEVAKFKESGLDFQPDAVLVFFIENDFGLPFYVRDIYNPGSMLNAMSFARLTWQAADPKIEEQKLQLTAYDPNKALADLSSVCRNLNIPLYFTINPKKNWQGLKRKLWVLKERPDIRFIEMRHDMMKFVKEYQIPEEALTLSFDPHPSPLRHKIYGNLLAPAFMEYIK
jgi:hypothetical protein